MGSKAGKKLPDLSIHPPLSLIHLGTRRGRSRGQEDMDRKTPMRLEALPCPSDSPVLGHPYACVDVPYPLLVPSAFSLLEGRQSILG